MSGPGREHDDEDELARGQLLVGQRAPVKMGSSRPAPLSFRWIMTCAAEEATTRIQLRERKESYFSSCCIVVVAVFLRELLHHHSRITSIFIALSARAAQASPGRAALIGTASGFNFSPLLLAALCHLCATMVLD